MSNGLFKYIPHSLYNGDVSYSMMSPCVVGGLHFKCLTDELEEKVLEETKDGQEKFLSISKDFFFNLFSLFV